MKYQTQEKLAQSGRKRVDPPSCPTAKSQKFTVWMTGEEAQQAYTLGNGNLSAGVRKAIREAAQ